MPDSEQWQRLEELLGQELGRVDRGLDPAAVLAFLESVSGSGYNTAKLLERFSSLRKASKMVEAMIWETDQLATQVKQQVKEEAEAEKAELLSATRQQAREIIGHCQKNRAAADGALNHFKASLEGIMDQTVKRCVSSMERANTVFLEALGRVKEMQEMAFHKAREMAYVQLDEIRKEVSTAIEAGHAELGAALDQNVQSIIAHGIDPSAGEDTVPPETSTEKARQPLDTGSMQAGQGMEPVEEDAFPAFSQNPGKEAPEDASQTPEPATPVNEQPPIPEVTLAPEEEAGEIELLQLQQLPDDRELDSAFKELRELALSTRQSQPEVTPETEDETGEIQLLEAWTEARDPQNGSPSDNGEGAALEQVFDWQKYFPENGERMYGAQSEAQETGATGEDAPGEEPAAGDEMEKDFLYSGEITLLIPKGARQSWMRQLRQRLLITPDVYIRLESGGDDSETMITVLLSAPVALASVLLEVPSVKRVVRGEPAARANRPQRMVLSLVLEDEALGGQH